MTMNFILFFVKLLINQLQNLHNLYKSNQISYEQALDNSMNQEDLLRLMGKGF